MDDKAHPGNMPKIKTTTRSKKTMIPKISSNLKKQLQEEYTEKSKYVKFQDNQIEQMETNAPSKFWTKSPQDPTEAKTNLKEQ